MFLTFSNKGALSHSLLVAGFWMHSRFLTPTWETSSITVKHCKISLLIQTKSLNLTILNYKSTKNKKIFINNANNLQVDHISFVA